MNSIMTNYNHVDQNQRYNITNRCISHMTFEIHWRQSELLRVFVVFMLNFTTRNEEIRYTVLPVYMLGFLRENLSRTSLTDLSFTEVNK